MIKIQLVHEIFIYILSAKQKSDEKQCRLKIENGFTCLGIAFNASGDLSGRQDFIKEVIYETPQIEEYPSLIKIMEDVMGDLEFDDDYLKQLRENTKKKDKIFMKLWTGLKVDNEDNKQKLNIKPHLEENNRKLNSNILTNRRRTGSWDKSDFTPERQEKEDAKWKNQRIDNYFKGGSINVKKTRSKGNSIERITEFDSKLINTKINLNNKFNQFPKSTKDSKGNIVLNISTSNKSFIPETLNLQSDLSYETFAEKIKNNSPSRHSLSNKSSLNLTNPHVDINHNSNMTPLSMENSKTFQDTTIKRPINISNFSGVYNFSNNNNFFSSAKSTTFSHVSGSNITDFSFKKNYSSISNAKSQDSDRSNSLVNSISSSRTRGFGINSILASKSLPKTKKTRNSKIFSDKKRKNKDKSVIIETFKEKCDKNNCNSVFLKKSENSDFNRQEKEKDIFKSMVNKKFYDNLKFTQKSPDVITQKEQIKEFLSQKKPRSRGNSVDEDEIIVYQTPIKSNTLNKKTNEITPSPNATTRKNLYNLFNQIEK